MWAMLWMSSDRSRWCGLCCGCHLIGAGGVGYVVDVIW